METDSIRPSGTATLVDIWIGGKLRQIVVSPDAIDAFVGIKQAATMSEDDRCEFVRKNLALVVSAVTATLREKDPTADKVIVGAGDLPGPDGSRPGERRDGERRKGDRRKSKRGPDELPQADRRRRDRRKADRRRDLPKTS